MKNFEIIKKIRSIVSIIKNIDINVRNNNQSLDKIELNILDINVKIDEISKTLLNLDEASNYANFMNYCFQSLNFIKFISSDFGSHLEVKKDLISVVIPTHTNPECLWTRTIPSVMNQIGAEIEIILVLDGQKEKVTSMRQEIDSILLSNKFKYEIKVIEGRAAFKENFIKFNTNIPKISYINWFSGGLKSLRIGIDFAKGQWILPFNHDDEIPTSETVTNLYKEILSKDGDVILGQVYQQSPDGQNNKLFTNKNFSQDDYGVYGSLIKKQHAQILYDENDIFFGIPADWGLISRLKFFRINVVLTDTIMCNYFPSNLWDIEL